eukprot:jgi/Antlo1/1741/1534
MYPAVVLRMYVVKRAKTVCCGTRLLLVRDMYIRTGNKKATLSDDIVHSLS